MSTRMEDLGFTRRGFLQASAASLALAPFGLLARADAGVDYIVAPERRGEARFGVGVLDLSDGSHRSIETHLLGHSLAGHPIRRHLAVLFAERPDRRSALVDLRAGEVVRVFDCEPGRHFYGHGGFTPDGRLVLDTENNALLKHLKSPGASPTAARPKLVPAVR